MLVRDIDLMDAIADLFGKRQFVKDKTDQLPCGETLDDCASNGAIVFSELQDPV